MRAPFVEHASGAENRNAAPTSGGSNSLQIQLRGNPATSACAAKHLTSAEGRLLPSDAGTPDACKTIAWNTGLFNSLKVMP